MTIEYRSANGGAEGLPELATDLVRRQVAVIFAAGPPAAAAAKRATQTIPIVFVSGGDPAQMGIVSSFHRPDRKCHRLLFLGHRDWWPKRLGTAMSCCLGPRALPCSSIRAMWQQPSQPCGTSPSSAARSVSTSKSITSAPGGSSTRLSPPSRAGGPKPCSSVPIRSSIPSARNSWTWQRAMRFPHPTSSAIMLKAGGLMSYGPDFADFYRQAGSYVGRLLKGVTTCRFASAAAD